MAFGETANRGELYPTLNKAFPLSSTEEQFTLLSTFSDGKYHVKNPIFIPELQINFTCKTA